ncbi:DUF2815 family protein [uncultured Ruminococcus sp.]|uniref:DUF2815 family protein n=1 Tax=uncultured Ruminococcus sp. TaxID=165186 RepID=UPI0025F4D516|nr:DUF2815 family protein [uncultured Ruminococcus sp.]
MALKANQITTDKVRLSYVHLDKPYAHDQKATPKYSVTVLLPKSDTATKARLDAAYQDAVNSGIANKWNGTLPPIIANPVYDGDGVRPNGDPFGPECKGHWVFTAGSTNPVPVVDSAQNPIINTTEVYSGCYARVCVSLFAYSNSGKRGIGCGLEAVQKLEDGDPLGGGVSVADAFGAPAQSPAQQYPQQTVPNYTTPSPAPQYPNGAYAAYDPITGTYR